jgi:hypothetical protein
MHEGFGDLFFVFTRSLAVHNPRGHVKEELTLLHNDSGKGLVFAAGKGAVQGFFSRAAIRA